MIDPDETLAYDRALDRIERAFEGVYEEDPYANLQDALTDLRHYAHAHNLDIFGAIDMSYTHYLEEQRERRAAPS